MNLSQLDRVNQAGYGRPGAVEGMARKSGFTDEGEHAAYTRMAEEMRQRPILDLGVGGGRTVELLRALTHDYVGVDYLPAMVEAARARFPDADIRLGDARQLSDFADARFALVAFSNHGVDSIGHEDRQLALAEAWRVLAPGGVFWFSTLNLLGPAARYRPWRPWQTFSPSRPHSLSDGWHYCRDLGRSLARVPVHTLRYERGMALAQSGEGWAEAPFFAGGWHVVAHYTTLPQLLRELESAGFAPGPTIFEDAHGGLVQPTDDLRPVFSFNVLARKPGALGADH